MADISLILVYLVGIVDTEGPAHSLVMSLLTCFAIDSVYMQYKTDMH